MKPGQFFTTHSYSGTASGYPITQGFSNYYFNAHRTF